jgi:glutamyl-tRNA synthetase
MSEKYSYSLATGADVRVRFCPSPTGTPHVGLVRTALFNWAYARHTGGTFIFRIEDTDAARDSEESYQQIIEALRWLKLDWDEGIEVGGPHEPYRQSQRSGIYRSVIDTLVESGHLYPSFSTPEEIEARNIAAGKDPKLGYDNADRDLTAAQRDAFIAEGRVPALRLRVPDEDITFDDLVRGEITFPAGSFPDFVVVRPNGDPLYTLVNPVDDALMQVTHVLRGEDLLSSTPRQIALYHALIDTGFTSHIPRFGHLPYVMGEGNKKLSKRDPQANLFHHRERGFIPEGLTNYLALLGWSLTHDRDVFSMQEMCDAFDVVNVNPNPARFDQKKADAINGDHIRLLSEEDLTHRLLPYLQDAHILPEQPSDHQMAILAAVTPLIQTRMNVLSEAPDLVSFLFVDSTQITCDDEALAGLPENAHEIVAAAVAALEQVPEHSFTHDQVQAALQSILIDEMQLKPRNAFGPVRTALSGKRISPPLFESMEILGKKESIDRLVRFTQR